MVMGIPPCMPVILRMGSGYESIGTPYRQWSYINQSKLMLKERDTSSPLQISGVVQESKQAVERQFRHS